MGVAAVVILSVVSSVSVDPSYWMLSTIQVSCPNLTDPLGYELIPIYTKYGPMIGLTCVPSCLLVRKLIRVNTQFQKSRHCLVLEQVTGVCFDNNLKNKTVTLNGDNRSFTRSVAAR